jgi:hypothetical protein
LHRQSSRSAPASSFARRPERDWLTCYASSK